MGALTNSLASVRFWVLALAGLVVALLVYYVAADRVTPFTSDAYVQALVVQMAPQVEGPVVAVHVTNGSRVKKGDPLYQIDLRPFQYEVDRLSALLVQTEQEIKQLDSALEAQQAIIQERQADAHNAKKTHDRIAKLAADNFAAQQKLDDANDRLSGSRALLHESTAEAHKLEQRLAAIIEGEHAEVRQVKAELAQAKLQLAWSKVIAPVDGIVDNLQLTVGTTVAVGDPVLSLVDTTRWWIVANYQENALSVIRPGQRVGLSFFMYPGEIFTGQVESIGWGVSQGQGVPTGLLPEIDNPSAWISRSQRFQVRIAPHDLGPDRPLRVGATVRSVVYAQETGLMNALAGFWLWVGSYLDYIY